MLNFNQLRVFYVAAKHLNFTSAAGELCISQPAVTAQVKSFEAYCNLKLFQKRGRRLFLTNEGRALFDYAEHIFGHEKEIENAIAEMLKLERGMLRLGTTKAYARYFMPLLLSRFHRTYSHIKITLDEGSSRDMILSLVDLKNEVAVIAKAIDHPEVTFKPLSKEEMVVILAPDHPLAKKKTVTFADLAQQPLIMKENGSGTRKVVDDMFATQGCKPWILMETSSAEFIKEVVQRGEGISFLVKAAVAAELKEGSLVQAAFRAPTLHLDVSLAYLKNLVLSPPAKAFVNLLGDLQSEYMHPQGIGLLMAKMLAQRKDSPLI
jgi:DNA-binding transcriptional LysR family regulator